jgi:hypothetical protein
VARFVGGPRLDFGLGFVAGRVECVAYPRGIMSG